MAVIGQPRDKSNQTKPELALPTLSIHLPRLTFIVGVFTNKSMQSATGGAGTVVGQADCIGGIRWDETSFFVASDIRNIENPQTGTTGTLNSMGLNPNVDAASEVIAHEIGHLMGAHPHYANCVDRNDVRHLEPRPLCPNSSAL